MAGCVQTWHSTLEGKLGFNFNTKVVTTEGICVTRVLTLVEPRSMIILASIRTLAVAHAHSNTQDILSI